MKMGLFRCLVVAAMLISTTSFAQNKAGHKINGYKYLCMEEQGNLHDLEDMFNAFFAEIGFTILTPDDEEELENEEKRYVLYGNYETKIVEDDFFSLSLTLRNSKGKIIFSSAKNSAIFFSLKKSIDRASDKIFDEIIGLNYKFDPTFLQKEGKKKDAENKEESLETQEE